MALIAQNHFQLILEVAGIIFALFFFLLNLVPLSLTIVTFFALGISFIGVLLFSFDIVLLFTSFGQNEFTHPFGPIILLAIITSLAALKVMKESGVNVTGLNRFVWVMLAAITLFGGMMHRSFLLLWLIGLFIGYFILSNSFREKTLISMKRILTFIIGGFALFGFMELLANIFNMPIFSPLTRISRLELNSIPSIKMLFNNIQLIGHNAKASFWGVEGTAFAEGYITLPVSYILMFGLPFPIFYGLLITKKDTIDYMLPGILGYAFDFGFLGFLALGLFVLGTIFVGFKLLYIYREKREKNNKRYLGKEVLLTGSLTAFIAQAIVGLFIFNRTINGSALITFICLGALVWAHTVSMKRET